MMDNEFKFSDSEFSNGNDSALSEELSYESNLTSIQHSSKSQNKATPKAHPRKRGSTKSKTKEVSNSDGVLSPTQSAICEASGNEITNQHDIESEKPATKTKSKIIKQKEEKAEKHEKVEKVSEKSKKAAKNICDIEENADSIYIEKNKKKSTVKYENESFIDLCLQVFSKHNPKNILYEYLNDPQSRVEIVKIIKEVNSHIQNCSDKSIRCIICKTTKSYQEFKELSTSVTGRQRTCIECSDKCKSKTIVNASDIEDI